MPDVDYASRLLLNGMVLQKPIRAWHRLREIRKVVNGVLSKSDDNFELRYTKVDRPTTSPKRVIGASLLEICFSVRSGQLRQKVDGNLMLRWFVGLGIDHLAWVSNGFNRSRDLLSTTEISCKVLTLILAQREIVGVLLGEHSFDDGTRIKALSPMKSFQLKADADQTYEDWLSDTPTIMTTFKTARFIAPSETDPLLRNAYRYCNADVSFKGKKSFNDIYTLTTSSEVQNYTRPSGPRTTSCFVDHALIENQPCIIIQEDLLHADSDFPRKVKLDRRHRYFKRFIRRLTLATEKCYISSKSIAELHEASISPLAPQKTTSGNCWSHPQPWKLCHFSQAKTEERSTVKLY